MHPRSDFDLVQMADIASPARGGYLSGYYYQCTVGSGLSTSATLGNGTLRVGKWRVTQRVKIAKLGLRVTAAGDAGCTLKITVFKDGRDANNVPGYPGALLWDSSTYGTLAGDAIASPEVTVNDFLDPGLYHVGAVIQGVTVTQPTIETVGGPLAVGDPMPLASTVPTTANNPALGFVYTGVTGAVPANFNPSPNLSTVLARVFFKTG